MMGLETLHSWRRLNGSNLTFRVALPLHLLTEVAIFCRHVPQAALGQQGGAVQLHKCRRYTGMACENTLRVVGHNCVPANKYSGWICTTDPTCLNNTELPCPL